MPNEFFTKKFGLMVGEDCEPYEVYINMGNQPPRKAIVATHPSKSDIAYNTGKDEVVVLEEQPSGALTWMMVHINRLIGGK